MPHPNAYGFLVTVRDDGPREKTVLVHDQDGNELGSVVIETVPTGLRFDVWDSNDIHVGQLIAH